MIFVRWVAPVILTLCGLFMIRMGIQWHRSGRAFKALLDIVAGISFLIMAWIIPSMGGN